jgi:hypothetical protein
MNSSLLQRAFSTATAHIHAPIRSHAWTHYANVRYYAKQYGNALEEYPLLTKGVSGAIIATLGDLTCQGIVHRKNDDPNKGRFHWDVACSARFALLAAFWVAPTGHFWYEYLARFGKSKVQVIKRVSLDQFMFKPFSSVVFLSSLWSMQGLNRTEIVCRLKENVPESLSKEWQYLIPV